ncbi:hypothetical protein [Butyrivibrio fibrisolvens]|nr:hypothetical protein [Butyrivibrio fibrisolvens]
MAIIYILPVPAKPSVILHRPSAKFKLLNNSPLYICALEAAARGGVFIS